MEIKTYKEAKRLLKSQQDFLNGPYKGRTDQYGFVNGLYNMLRSVLVDEKDGKTKQEVWGNALFLLNREQEHLNRLSDPKRQVRAFVEGLRIMLDVIVAEGYTEWNGLCYTQDRTWKIAKEAV